MRILASQPELTTVLSSLYSFSYFTYATAMSQVLNNIRYSCTEIEFSLLFSLYCLSPLSKLYSLFSHKTIL